MQIRELVDYIEEFAPINLQESYDNSGLICGDPNMEVSSVLLCIDITEDVVDEAIQNGYNFIISHHPLIFKGLKRITTTTYVERCVINAIKNDVAIYAAHTNIDLVCNGVSGRMADKLNLINRIPLHPKQSLIENTGYGIVGELFKGVQTDKFLEDLKEAFNCTTLRYTNIVKPNISKVAVCGGSGATFINDALAHNADIYISGDFKYHDFFLTENRIILADIGHYESEQFTKEIFYEILTKKIATFAVRYSKINTNPIKYL